MEDEATAVDLEEDDPDKADETIEDEEDFSTDLKSNSDGLLI